MTKKFCLSNKDHELHLLANNYKIPTIIYLQEDVAEAVKRLKNFLIKVNLSSTQRQLLWENIDKIFGQELI